MQTTTTTSVTSASSAALHSFHSHLARSRPRAASIDSLALSFPRSFAHYCLPLSHLTLTFFLLSYTSSFSLSLYLSLLPASSLACPTARRTESVLTSSSHFPIYLSILLFLSTGARCRDLVRVCLCQCVCVCVVHCLLYFAVIPFSFSTSAPT